jgi:hypothetical protein
MSVEEQVAATSSAMQTATAVIEKAVSDALTEAAPPPSDTPLPETDTPVPSDTPEATETPTEVVDTGGGSGSGGGEPVGYTACKDNSGGRTKVRVNNTTGNYAYLTLVGPEAYQCLIPPGSGYQIFILGGIYTASAIMCGNQNYYYGSFVINATWQLTLRC